MHIRRFIFLGLTASTGLCWLASGSAWAQQSPGATPANRRPVMPPKPPILPALNGRPPAFQNGHGLFGNAQGTAAAGQAGQAGQQGQFGQQGGGIGGGGAFGAAGGGLGAFGQFGNAGGGIGGLIGGLGGGGLKGFGLGGGVYNGSPYRDGVGLTGGADRLSGKDAEIELPRRAASGEDSLHRLMLQPARSR